MDRSLRDVFVAVDMLLSLKKQNQLIWSWMQLKKQYRRSIRTHARPNYSKVSNYPIQYGRDSQVYSQNGEKASDKHSTTTYQPKITRNQGKYDRYTERKERKAGSVYAYTSIPNQTEEEDDGFERLVMEKLSKLEENMNEWMETQPRKVKKPSNYAMNPFNSKENRGNLTTTYQRNKHLPFKTNYPPKHTPHSSNSPPNFKYIPHPNSSNTQQLQEISRVVKKTQQRWVDEVKEVQKQQQVQQRGQINRIRNCREGRVRPQVQFGERRRLEGNSSQKGSSGSKKRYQRSPQGEKSRVGLRKASDV